MVDGAALEVVGKTSLSLFTGYRRNHYHPASVYIMKLLLYFLRAESEYYKLARICKHQPASKENEYW